MTSPHLSPNCAGGRTGAGATGATGTTVGPLHLAQPPSQKNACTLVAKVDTMMSPRRAPITSVFLIFFSSLQLIVIGGVTSI